MSTELSIYDRDLNNEWISVDERVFRIGDKSNIPRLFNMYFEELEKFDQVVINIYLSKRNINFIRAEMGHLMDMEDYTMWTASIVIDDYWGDKIVFSTVSLSTYAHNEDILRRFEIMEI